MDVSERWGERIAIANPGGDGSGNEKPQVSFNASINEVLDNLGLEFLEGRRYGVCDVFTVETTDEDDNTSSHVIDCIDNQKEDEDGHYHIAVFCIQGGEENLDDFMIVRTGPDVPSNADSDQNTVPVTLGETTYTARWVPNLDTIEGVNSAQFNEDTDHRIFLDSVEEAEALTFSMRNSDDSGDNEGTLRYNENDPNALSEWESRCSNTP